MYRNRTNLTPHVDFITRVVAFLGFKFLNPYLMGVLVLMFLVHHTLIRIAEMKSGSES